MVRCLTKGMKRKDLVSSFQSDDFSHTHHANQNLSRQSFNRLIAIFDFAFRNLPEWIIEGRITSKGRIEYYFRAFGSISVVFIEVKFAIGDTEERLDAVAQIIAECDGGSFFSYARCRDLFVRVHSVRLEQHNARL